MSRLSDIEGIGEVYSAKLEDAGISTLEALLEAGSERKERKEIAENAGISEKLVLKWINRADLARVNGISTQYADLLEVAGVDTVPELAQRRADNLHATVTEVNDNIKLVRKVPALSQVENWIAQAKKLPRVVNY